MPLKDVFKGWKRPSWTLLSAEHNMGFSLFTKKKSIYIKTKTLLGGGGIDPPLLTFSQVVLMYYTVVC